MIPFLIINTCSVQISHLTGMQKRRKKIEFLVPQKEAINMSFSIYET